MKEGNQNLKVVLIGGASCSGKSSLGRSLADSLGWELQSTDEFARHPGRPWRNDGSYVPRSVADYFSSHSDTELLQDVWRHYRDNVWPIARAVTSSRVNNSFDVPLVLEGSSILPELVTEVSCAEVCSLWLVGDEDLLIERIRRESGYRTRSVKEQLLIDVFVRRAVAFDKKLRASLIDTGLQMIQTSNEVTTEELVRTLRKSALTM